MAWPVWPGGFGGFDCACDSIGLRLREPTRSKFQGESSGRQNQKSSSTSRGKRSDMPSIAQSPPQTSISHSIRRRVDRKVQRDEVFVAWKGSGGGLIDDINKSLTFDRRCSKRVQRSGRPLRSLALMVSCWLWGCCRTSCHAVDYASGLLRGGGEFRGTFAVPPCGAPMAFTAVARKVPSLTAPSTRECCHPPGCRPP